MLNLTIVQIGYKVAKKTDQNRTVFLSDASNHLFETSTGLGMDLTAKLAQLWFAQVVAKNVEAIAMINTAVGDTTHQHHAIALDLELDENQTFKRGLSLSFNTLMMYLRLIGIIEYQEQITTDHKGNSAGCIYVIRFKV